MMDLSMGDLEIILYQDTKCICCSASALQDCVNKPQQHENSEQLEIIIEHINKLKSNCDVMLHRINKFKENIDNE